MIFVIESLLRHESHASLLWNVIFWTTLVEGSIALAAIAEVTRAKWIAPVRKEMFSVYPILPLLGVLFLLSMMQWDLYPWMENQGVWLNKWFFLIRNVASLMLCFIFAWAFAISSGRNTKNRSLFASLYLLSFVISQSLIAFDWVMSLEYPWISTLFGGYFIVESMYAGIALSGIYCFLFSFKPSDDNLMAAQETLKDSATLMFGFSLFWVGLLYAQFLVIWYGNIPEETGFIIKRITSPPFREFSLFILIALFFIPFLVFLSRKAKSMPVIVLSIAVLIVSGLLVERTLFLAPVVPLKGLTTTLEFLLMLCLFVAVLLNKNLFLTSSDIDTSLEDEISHQ
jgi:hypothetical protein